MGRLELLPAEILCQIATSIDCTKSLKSLRLTCRALSGVATKELFSTVILSGSCSTIEKYYNILGSYLADNAKNVVVYPDYDIPIADSEYITCGLFKANLGRWYFLAAYGQLNSFRNVERLSIHLRRPSYQLEFNGDLGDDIYCQLQIPQLLKNYYGPKIKHLELEGTEMLDIFVKGRYRYNYESWKNCLSNLQTLRVSYTIHRTCYYIERSSDDLMCKTIGEQPFLSAATNLTYLTLYFDVFSGFDPWLEEEFLVFFQSLKKLSLGNLTFCHPTHLDWILRHGATLERLTLNNCPILFQIRYCNTCMEPIDRDKGEKEIFNILMQPDNRENILACQLHDASHRRDLSINDRWSDYFRKFRLGLPNLHHFLFSQHISNESFDITNLSSEYDMDVSLYSDRYIAYDCFSHGDPWLPVALTDENLRVMDNSRIGEDFLSPHHFIPGNSKGRLHEPGFRPDCDTEDIEELVELMKRTKQRLDVENLSDVEPSSYRDYPYPEYAM